MMWVRKMILIKKNMGMRRWMKLMLLLLLMMVPL
jgi:hypothetical protein